jgi:hypothetical protein
MTTSIIQSCLHLHFECSFSFFGPKIIAYTLKPCLYAYCKKLVTPLIWVCTLIHISSVSRHLPMLARDFKSVWYKFPGFPAPFSYSWKFLIHISSVSRHLPMLARDFNSQSGINFQAFLPHSVIAENCQNAFFFKWWWSTPITHVPLSNN